MTADPRGVEGESPQELAQWLLVPVYGQHTISTYLCPPSGYQSSVRRPAAHQNFGLELPASRGPTIRLQTLKHYIHHTLTELWCTLFTEIICYKPYHLQTDPNLCAHTIEKLHLFQSCGEHQALHSCFRRLPAKLP